MLNSPKFIREIAEIAEITEIKNNAAKLDPNGLQPPSENIVTCSERRNEDGKEPGLFPWQSPHSRRVSHTPLETTAVTGGGVKDLKRMNSLQSALNLKA